MVTEADHGTWRPGDLAPYVDHAIFVFGEDRIMFGSDWPVCRLAAEYGDVINALRTVTAGATVRRKAMRKLFGGERLPVLSVGGLRERLPRIGRSPGENGGQGVDQGQ